MAVFLEIQVKLVEENTHKLIDIFHPTVGLKVVLPLNEAIMKLAKTLWKTLSSIPPMAK